MAFLQAAVFEILWNKKLKISIFEYILLDVTVQFTFDVLVDGINKTCSI